MHSFNHCCSGKTINTIYCECVFIALGIQHAKCSHYRVICGLSGCTVFFLYYLMKGTVFEKKILRMKFVLISSTTYA